MSRSGPAKPSAESSLIARYFAPIAGHPGALQLSDDAAVVRPRAGQDLVLTCDAVLAGVHYLHTDPADGVARKALRVNLSDLAAKGATPAGFLLTLALTRSLDEDWLKGFAKALASDAKSFACPLLGGDTVRTPGPLTVAITAYGTLPKGSMVRRAGARPGDHILVSGTIGDAALGLALTRRFDTAARWKLSDRARDFLIGRYRVPQPRTALAPALRTHASSAMDISDGLVGDLAKLCRVSGVAAAVNATEVPLSTATRSVLAARPRRIETVLTGGDDYEIICTVAASRVDKFRAAAAAAGVPVAEIGRIVKAGRGEEGAVHVTGADNRELTFSRESFSHF